MPSAECHKVLLTPTAQVPHNNAETWHAGRPRPWPHCVRWGPSSPSPERGRSPQFSADICRGQMAAWIEMPLGMEIGLGPGDFVLDRDPAPSPKRGAESPKFSAHVDCGQTAAWIKMALGRPWSSPHCSKWGHSSPPQKWGQSVPIFGPSLLWPNVWMHRDATWYGGRPQPRGLVLDGDPAPPSQKGGGARWPSPQF